MKNIQEVYTENLRRPGQKFMKPDLKTQPLMENQGEKTDKTMSSRAPERILVNRDTGGIFLATTALALNFPMLVVRHGQTDGNVRRTFQGHVDGPDNQLNSVGRQQAQLAAKHLYEQLFKLFGAHLKAFAKSGKLVILTSPLTRAQDTTKAFTDYFEEQTGLALTPSIEDDLAEMFFGAIEGLSTEEITDKELREHTSRFRNDQDAIVNWKGTGESFLDVVYRANNLLERLNEQYHQDDVLVISFAHGTLINALRAVVGDRKLIEDNGFIAFRKHPVENAQPFWLGDSRQVGEQLYERIIRKLA